MPAAPTAFVDATNFAMISSCRAWSTRRAASWGWSDSNLPGFPSTGTPAKLFKVTIRDLIGLLIFEKLCANNN
jgi:hypothetical protein